MDAFITQLSNLFAALFIILVFLFMADTTLETMIGDPYHNLKKKIIVRLGLDDDD